MGHPRDILDRAVEGNLVRLRGPREAAELADELEGRRPDLILRGGRFEVMQGFDTAAHGWSTCL